MATIKIINGLRGINMPKTIGQDKFIENSKPNVRADLFAELRNLTGQNKFR